MDGIPASPRVQDGSTARNEGDRPGQVVKLPPRAQVLEAERAKTKDTDRAEKLVSELDGKTVHEVIATGKEMLKSYGTTCDHSMDSSTGAVSEITNFMQGSVHELVKKYEKKLGKGRGGFHSSRSL